MEKSEKRPGRSVIITGANTGMGYACAKKIARLDPCCTVIIAGRNTQRISDAAQKLKEDTGSDSIAPLKLDLASFASIREFASSFSQGQFPPLKCLICNAGIRVTQSIQVTQDGCEATFGINYLGHFLLTNLLLPLMAQDARIIMVSSRTHDYRDVSPFPKSVYKCPAALADPHPPEGQSDQYFTVHAYANSKLCLTMFAFELERRIKESGRNIAVNVFDPGGMVTELTRDYTLLIKGMMRVAWPVVRILPNMSSPRASAEFMANLAVSEEYANVSAKYFTMLGSYRRGAKEAEACPLVFDREKTLELWEGSEELTGGF